MTDSDEKMSPEEKLLRVIQGGDKEQPTHVPLEAATPAAPPAGASAVGAALGGAADQGPPGGSGPAPPVEPKPSPTPPSTPAPREPAAAPTAAVEAPAVEAAPGSKPAPRPKPKLRKASPRTRPAPRPGPPPEESPAADKQPERIAAAAREAPVVSAARAGAAKKPPPGPAPAQPAAKVRPSAPGGAIRVANRVVAVAAVLMLLMAGFEVYSHASARRVEAPQDELTELPTQPRTALMPLPTVQAAFLERNPFAIPGEQRRQGGEDGGSRPRPQPIEIYMAKNVSLLGIAAVDDAGKQEAIVLDRSIDALQFVGLGQSLTLKGESFVLKEIGDDHVILSDGKREYKVQ